MCGIAGNTVAEAKLNMTQSEYLMWREYRRLRGSLNTGRRVEQAVGNLMAFYHNGKVKSQHRIDAIKLMPHEDQPEDVEIDLFEALAGGLV